MFTNVQQKVSFLIFWWVGIHNWKFVFECLFLDSMTHDFSWNSKKRQNRPTLLQILYCARFCCFGGFAIVSRRYILKLVTYLHNLSKLLWGIDGIRRFEVFWRIWQSTVTRVSKKSLLINSKYTSKRRCRKISRIVFINSY